MNKAVAQHKALICSLADRVHALVDTPAGVQGTHDRDLLAKARLAGWKPLHERARKAAP